MSESDPREAKRVETTTEEPVTPAQPVETTVEETKTVTETPVNPSE